MPKFIKIELKSDSDLDSEVESKSDAKLMAKLEKSDSDSEWKNTQSHWFGSGTSKECSKSEHLNRG